jgi:hypothetical protein
MKKAKKKRIVYLSTVICFLFLVLSTATYAWFEQGNRLKVTNLSLLAGGSGILQIAEDLGNNPGEYASELDLSVVSGSDAMETMLLNPVTTKNGINFFKPVYKGNTVVDVKSVTDNEQLNTLYVYEKSFYLKAGPNPNGKEEKIVVTEGKMYDVFLVGPATNQEHTGTHVFQSSDSDGSSVPGDTAVNAIRISFELEDGTVVIYEPNADQSNRDNNRAEDMVKNQCGRYDTVMQGKDGIFIQSDNGEDSPILFQIEESKDVKVTMRVWIEGTDLDCTDSIALDKVTAMFEFMSNEAVYENKE